MYRVDTSPGSESSICVAYNGMPSVCIGTGVRAIYTVGFM